MYYNHVFVLSCRLPSLWMIRIILGLRDIVSRDIAEPNLQAGLASCDRRLMGQAECIVLELDFWYLNYLNIKNRDLTWFDQLGTNNHGNIHIYTYIHIYILEDHRVVFSIWGCSWNREGQDNTNCVIFNRETVMVWGTHLYQEAIFFWVWLQWSAMSSVQPQILWISVHCVSAANHIKELRLGALTLADHVSFLLCYAGPFCRLHSSHTFQTHQWTDLWPFTPYSAWKELSACVAWASIRQTQKQQPWI